MSKKANQLSPEVRELAIRIELKDGLPHFEDFCISRRMIVKIASRRNAVGLCGLRPAPLQVAPCGSDP